MDNCTLHPEWGVPFHDCPDCLFETAIVYPKSGKKTLGNPDPERVRLAVQKARALVTPEQSGHIDLLAITENSWKAIKVARNYIIANKGETK